MSQIHTPHYKSPILEERVKVWGRSRCICRNSWCIKFSVDFLPKPLQSQFKQQQLCSFATYPRFPPIVNLSSLLWPWRSIESQLLALHIPPSRGHKPQLLSPTLCRSLENGDTGWQSHCIKSICPLNLQPELGLFLAAVNRQTFVCLLVLPSSQIWWAKLPIKLPTCQEEFNQRPQMPLTYCHHGNSLQKSVLITTDMQVCHFPKDGIVFVEN